MALRQRNDPIRLFWRRMLLLGLFALVAASASGVWNIYQKERESARLRQQAEAQLKDLETRQANLAQEVQSLQSKEGMEAAVREQFGMAEQGEGMVVIVEPDKPQPVQATSSITQWFENMFSRL